MIYDIKLNQINPLKEQFLYLCETLAESGKSNSDDLKKNLGHLEAKLEKLEERFAFGEIDREIFERVWGKLKQEIQSIKDELDRSGLQLSNPSMLIDQSLEIISNLSEFWASGDYDHKRRLQELLFPGGILFDKQIDNYRTPNVNSVLSVTRSLSNSISENKNGQIRNLSDLPDLVDLTDRLSNPLKQLYAASQQVMKAQPLEKGSTVVPAGLL